MDRIGPFTYRRFAPRLPVRRDGREIIAQPDARAAQSAPHAAHPVVIAGGGPVGLATALALAQWGVRSVVLEADTTVCTGSRAICISRRSLEILHRLGAAQGMLGKGLPWEGGRSFHGTREILHFRMPHDALQKLPPMINLQQYWIEHFLVEAAQAHAELIDLRWGSELVGLRPDDDGVSLQVRCEVEDYETRAQWLLACDGGQSFVRRSLGAKLEGVGFEGKYVIVDVELPSAHPTERRAWFDPPSNPGSTLLMHRQPDDLWRIDYQIPDDADLDEALRPENVEPVVRRHLEMIGEAHLPWKIAWISAYRAGAMTLGRYRYGRVLFAGNAAHALPIFGVRGLNSGFDDADNLGWKLAMVIRGLAADALLDTYDDERLHAFRVNAAAAIQSTEFMAPPARGFALMREAALTLAHRHPEIARLANPRQTSVIRYDGSPLNRPSDAFDSGPPPGAVLPECPVDGSDAIAFLTELAGPHFTVLWVRSPERAPAAGRAAAGPAVEAAPAASLLDELGAAVPGVTLRGALLAADRASTPAPPGWVVLGDPDGRAAHVLGASHGAVYLLRPDGHLLGRWHITDASAIGRTLADALRAVVGGRSSGADGTADTRAPGRQKTPGMHAPSAGAASDRHEPTPPPPARLHAPGQPQAGALSDADRDAVYRRLCRAVSDAGDAREPLLLARLALLLAERVGDAAGCLDAIDEATRDLPEPSLSRNTARQAPGTG